MRPNNTHGTCTTKNKPSGVVLPHRTSAPTGWHELGIHRMLLTSESTWPWAKHFTARKFHQMDFSVFKYLDFRAEQTLGLNTFIKQQIWNTLLSLMTSFAFLSIKANYSSCIEHGQWWHSKKLIISWKIRLIKSLIKPRALLAID